MKSAHSTNSRFFGWGSLALALGTITLIGCTTDPKPTPSNSCVDTDLDCPKAFLLDTGAVIFSGSCASCHGDAGEGSRGPQVANSDFVMGSKERLIRLVLNGNMDTITVNGVVYAGGGMPAQRDDFGNVGIAGILTYIRAALNDSLVSNCVADPNDPSVATCTKTPRPAADIEADYVAVWEVKAVRDTLPPPVFE